MSYPYMKKTLIAFLFLGVSILAFIRFGKNPFSIIGAMIGFLIFSYNFKKIVAPIIFLIIFLLPLTFFSFFPFSKTSIPFLRFYNFFPTEGVNFSNVENPIKSIPSAERIEIDGPGFLVEFDKNSDDIKIPENIKVKRFGNTLNIETLNLPKLDHRFFFNFKNPFKGRSFRAKKIIIGAKFPIKKLSINAMGVRISGYIKVEELSIDGMGIDIEGTLDVDSLEADGMGVRLNASVVRAPSIEIDGMGADVDLNYISSWEGIWSISVDGLGSRVRYTLPPNNPGKLNIEKQGLGNVVERYGD